MSLKVKFSLILHQSHLSEGAGEIPSYRREGDSARGIARDRGGKWRPKAAAPRIYLIRPRKTLTPTVPPP